MKKIKILAQYYEDLWSGNIRIKWQMEHLASTYPGIYDVKLVNDVEYKDILWADIVVHQEPLMFSDVNKTVRSMNDESQEGIKVPKRIKFVYDFCDIVDPKDTSNELAWLWRHNIMHAGHVTTSTDPLIKEARDVDPKVDIQIIPEMIYRKYRKPPKVTDVLSKQDGICRIGWVGNFRYNDELNDLLQIMRTAVNMTRSKKWEGDQIEFVLFGFGKHIRDPHIKYIEDVPMDKFMDTLHKEWINVGMNYLLDTPTNNAKSINKFFEYGMIYAPAILPEHPYKQEISEEAALFFKDKEELLEHMLYLASSPDIRLLMGGEAYKEVQRHILNDDNNPWHDYLYGLKKGTRCQKCGRISTQLVCSSCLTKIQNEIK